MKQHEKKDHSDHSQSKKNAQVRHASQELVLLKKQCDDYLNGWKRALADFENYKKDASQRLSAIREQQLIDMANQMFPIMDIFEQALTHTPDEHKKASWYQGFIHASKGWEHLLKVHGITKIESAGKEFNPEFHEAIHTEHDESKDDHEITSVASEGYKMHDRTIRPAKVTVNNIKNNN